MLAEQAAKDPAAARSLVEGLPPGGVKQRAAFAVISKPDAESATWLISQADRSAGIEWNRFASHWASSDATALKQYLGSADLDRLPPQLVDGGFFDLMREDGPGTMAWSMETGSERLRTSALSNWGSRDSPAAAAWLKEHASGDWNDSAVREISVNYLSRAPGDAVDWATSLAPGKVRDTALGSLRQYLPSIDTLKPDQRAALQTRLAAP